jgi:dephospho-CoA kinase
MFFPDLVQSELNKVSRLDEKLIILGKGSKKGQIIFLAGGAASGKGFAINRFIDSSSYIIRNPDDIKKRFLNFKNLGKKYPELKGLQLKNPKDVEQLHFFIKNKKIADKRLELLLNDMKKNELPNIIFDRTFRNTENISSLLPILLAAGYEPKNIHVVWVLANYKIAIERNKNRERVVPEDVLIHAHIGAAKTMTELFSGNSKFVGKKAVDGDIKIVLNNPEESIFFKDEEGKDITKTNTGKLAALKSFSYITMKKSGKPIITDLVVREKLSSWIDQNTPKQEIK